MKNQARGIGHLQKNITHSLKGYLTWLKDLRNSMRQHIGKPINCQ
jgi:hypothetical protein